MRIRAGSLAFVSVLLAASVSEAQVPRLLGYQGRLLRADGSAATGTATVGFAVWDAATAGSQLWSESQTLGLSDGYYATFLGIVTAPPESLFASGSRWLEVRVGNEALAPRQQVGAVPWAMSSRTAQSVSGGSASVTSLQVGGQTVVDSAGRLAGSARYSAGPGVQIDPVSQTISLAACPDGQVLRRDGTTWACAIPNAGSVTGVSAGAPLNVSGSPSTPQISMLRAGAGFDGYLSSSDWSRFSGKYDGTTTCGGDLSGALASPVVARLQSRSVSPVAPADAQVLKWSSLSSQWEPAADATTPVVARAPLTAEGTSTAGYLLSMQAADRDRDGYLASSDFARFDGKFDAATECTGDLSGTLPGPTVVALQSHPVSTVAPGFGQVLFWSGTVWEPASLVASDIADLATGYVALTGSQSVAGAKNFETPPTFGSPLPISSGGTGTSAGLGTGGIVFGGSDGSFAQDGSDLFWDIGLGRLGVGTALPQAPLHVVGTGSGTNVAVAQFTVSPGGTAVKVVNNDGSGRTALMTKAVWGSGDNSGDSLILGATDNNALSHRIDVNRDYTDLGRADGTSFAHVDNSGNVGIGTTSPAARLDARGTARVDVLKVDTDRTDSTRYFQASSYGSDGVIRLNPGPGSTIYMDREAGSAKDLQIWDGLSTPVLSVQGSTRRVGVGTQSPAGTFEISGPDVPTLRLSNPADGTTTMRLARSGSAAEWGVYRYGSAQSDRFCVGVIGANEPLCITTGGSVGIGTGSPGQPLEVAGVGQAQRWRALDSGGNTVIELAGQTDSSFVEAFAASDRNVKKPLNLNPWGGSVGIGLTNPLGRLQVKSDNNAGSLVVSGIGGAAINLYNPSGFVSINSGGAAGTTLSDTTGEVLRVEAGKVGIGTTSPAQPLHVRRATSLTNTIAEAAHVEAKTTGTFASGFGPTVGFWGSMTGQDNVELGQIGAVNVNGAGAYGDLVFYTRPNAPVQERMRITNDGNVGIGTTSPTSRLTLGDSDPVSLIFTSGGNADLIVRAGSDYNAINSKRTDPLHFQVNDTTRMMIDGAGNVGVGTTSPVASLDVAGGIRVGSDSTCNSGKAGTLRWSSSRLEVCDGSGWVKVGGLALALLGNAITGSPVTYIADGQFRSDNGNGSARTNTAVLTGDFNVQFKIGAGVRRWVPGVFASGEVGTFLSTSNLGGMNSMTNGYYVNTEAANSSPYTATVFQGTTGQVTTVTLPATTSDTLLSFRRSGGSISLWLDGVQKYTFGAAYTGDMYISLSHQNGSSTDPDITQVGYYR